MASGKAHMLAGCATGLLVSCYDQSGRTEASHNPVIAGCLGSLAAKLPDILEPATNPHHRQFCHSLLVLGAVGYGFKRVYEWEPKDDMESFLRVLALAATAGYISHLLLDGITPRSLPLIGRLN